MPTSVFVAITSASLLFAIRCISAFYVDFVGKRWPIHSVITFMIAFVVICGLVEKSRLAWQWGRIAGIVTAIWAFVALYIQVTGSESITMGPAALTVSGLLGLMMTFALDRRTARDYYHLHCPKCGSPKVKPVDFWFSWAKCRKCDAKF